MGERIEPKILKGFRDFLPAHEAYRRQIIRNLEHVFSLSGFVPIDTPALEYTEILLGKSGGETEKQVYRFSDQGKRDVTLRYDLTVPFARYMAQHKQELILPFKRYHIAKVWRGEKPHKGRFREFVQCDFDIVGTDSDSADFEVLLTIYHSLKNMKIDKFTIHISHRGILTDYIHKLGFKKQAVAILRIIDKLQKIGKQDVSVLLNRIIPEKSVNTILDFINPESTFQATIEKLSSSLGVESPHLQRIQEIFRNTEELSITSHCTFDPSITRGLDYYTGVVFETYLDDLPAIGSICSGGRYDNLVSLFSKETLPGVGASIGLDRLIAALEELNILPASRLPTALLILCIDEELTGYYHKLAAVFTEQGIAAEVYLEKKKLAVQFNFAAKKDIPFALICGGEEKSKGKITIKDLRSRKSYTEMTIQEAITFLKKEVFH
jgi:histidyl-tRNA synthetase